MHLFTISGNIVVKDDVIKVKGLASTEDIDRDGEIILKEGINFEPLLSYGYITYEHNPLDIIGIPTKAYINDEGLVIEGELFSHHPRVKWLLKVNEAIKSHKDNRNRGVKLSIEGYPRVRKGAKIEKVDVVNVAVTLVPVNPNTYLDFLTKSITLKTFYDRYFCHHFEKDCECVRQGDLLGEIRRGVILKSLVKTLRAGHTIDTAKLRNGEALRRQSIEGDRPEDELKEWDEYVHILNFREKGDKIKKLIKILDKYGVHPSLALSLLGELIRIKSDING